MPLKGTGGNIDSPVGGRGAVRGGTQQSMMGQEEEEEMGYLWISGLFLGFIISASAAFLWYMAKRSLKVMSEEGKC